jgi:asparagine synthase (glutamine-hydrolysing)
MCGILGIFTIVGEAEIIRPKFEEALATMTHRGPDAGCISYIGGKLALGHRRLAIIDLNKESNQPFQLENKYWIIFNGEIYNYIDLRNELRALGNDFQTESDTEVLLRAYIVWGQDCVRKFNGMWAFAIYDSVRRELFCSRDRFGVKPFNYSLINGQLIFSSEIKAIIKYKPYLAEADFGVIANYIKIAIGAQIDRTWFRNVSRLMPAHNLTASESGIKITRYWQYPSQGVPNTNLEDAVPQYKTLLADAVRLRMRSDVPVGFTLSSGIDSTALVALLSPDLLANRKTYTAAFSETPFRRSEKRNFKKDEIINEPKIVKQLGNDLGFSPNIIEIDYSNYVNRLRRLIWHLESGHGSPAIFPLDQVLNAAAKDVTVVIEGQGADELLGGYISNLIPLKILNSLQTGHFLRALKDSSLYYSRYSLMQSTLLALRQARPQIWRKLYFEATGINRLLTGALKDQALLSDYPYQDKIYEDPITQNLYEAHTGGLVNLLHYGDAISMAHSLESRLPFMDYRLVEYAFKLSSDLKVARGFGKLIHRRAMEGVVPNYILNNPIKLGFESPLTHLFATSSEAEAMLLSKSARDRGLFSPQELGRLLDETRSGARDHSRLLFRVLSAEIWFREFID